MYVFFSVFILFCLALLKKKALPTIDEETCSSSDEEVDLETEEQLLAPDDDEVVELLDYTSLPENTTACSEPSIPSFPPGTSPLLKPAVVNSIGPILPTPSSGCFHPYSPYRSPPRPRHRKSSLYRRLTPGGVEIVISFKCGYDGHLARNCPSDPSTPTNPKISQQPYVLPPQAQSELPGRRSTCDICHSECAPGFCLSCTLGRPM